MSKGKKIRGSLASYQKDGEGTVCLEELGNKLLNIFEQPFSARIPFVLCCELQILAHHYLHLASKRKKSK